jgi:hypothetical protein
MYCCCVEAKALPLVRSVEHDFFDPLMGEKDRIQLLQEPLYSCNNLRMEQRQRSGPMLPSIPEMVYLA